MEGNVTKVARHVSKVEGNVTKSARHVGTMESRCTKSARHHGKVAGDVTKMARHLAKVGRQVTEPARDLAKSDRYFGWVSLTTEVTEQGARWLANERNSGAAPLPAPNFDQTLRQAAFGISS